MIDTNDNINVTPLIFVWRLNYHNKFDNIEKLEMFMIFKPKMKILYHPSFVMTTAFSINHFNGTTS